MKTCALTLWLILTLCGSAQAMEIGLQDQGADAGTLSEVAGDLGVTTLRVIASPENPKTEQVQGYRASGYHVQLAIQMKRWHTAGSVRGMMRRYHGAVRTVSIGNEPELNGISPCTYARLYASTRRMIRREFPGVRVGFGEFSPARPLEYLRRTLKCGTTLRADFAAIHPYQFFSDPLGAPSERSGVGTWVGLGNLWRFRRELRAMGSPPIRCTEFSYLVTGKYKIPVPRASSYWPRAITAARRHCQQLIIYGLGVVPAGSWGSAALLDGASLYTDAFFAIARALRRFPAQRLGEDHEIPRAGPDAQERPRPPIVGHAAQVESPQEVPDVDSTPSEPVPDVPPPVQTPDPEPVPDPSVPPPSVDETPQEGSPPMEPVAESNSGV